MKKILTLITLTVLLFTGQAFAQKTIVANDDNIKEIVTNEIKRLGNSADLNHIDVSNVTNMHRMFRKYLFKGDISKWDVSNVTDMNQMFWHSKFNGDISKWDVSNVTNMNGMFDGSQFKGDISSWNVSSVMFMNGMFYESQFNGDISNWDVGNVTDMRYMFVKSPFNGDISGWDVSNVTDMRYMFVKSPFNGDISGWDVSNVRLMNSMFEESQFNGDISNWDVSNVTGMGGMFYESQFNGDISNWDVSNVESMWKMFQRSEFNGDISNWDVSKVFNMDYMFKNSKFNGDVSKWWESRERSVTSTHEMFDKSILVSIGIFTSSMYWGYSVGNLLIGAFVLLIVLIITWVFIDISRMKKSDNKNKFSVEGIRQAAMKAKPAMQAKQIAIETKDKSHAMFKCNNENIERLVKNKIGLVNHEADLNHLDVSNVTDMKGIFKNSQFNGDISKWDVSNVTDMKGIFENSQFNGDISKWDVSNVTNMWSMFKNSKFNGDISKWDVSKVTNMWMMFDKSKFNGDISKWVVKPIDSTEYWSRYKTDVFRLLVPEEIKNLGNEADLNHIDTAFVNDMSGIFENSQFTGDISKWDTSKVENMSSMFKNSKFNGDISKWDVSSVKNMEHIFENSQFTGDISKWDTSNINGSLMFEDFHNGKIDFEIPIMTNPGDSFRSEDEKLVAEYGPKVMLSQKNYLEYFLKDKNVKDCSELSLNHRRHLYSSLTKWNTNFLTHVKTIQLSVPETEYRSYYAGTRSWYVKEYDYRNRYVGEQEKTEDVYDTELVRTGELTEKDVRIHDHTISHGVIFATLVFILALVTYGLS
jgi:surface protein